MVSPTVLKSTQQWWQLTFQLVGSRLSYIPHDSTLTTSPVADMWDNGKDCCSLLRRLGPPTNKKAKQRNLHARTDRPRGSSWGRACNGAPGVRDIARARASRRARARARVGNITLPRPLTGWTVLKPSGRVPDGFETGLDRAQSVQTALKLARRL